MKNKQLAPVRSREEILSDLCSIECAVSGKITVKNRPLKSGGSASYYQLQQWIEGRNVTTHIPSSKLEQFRESVAGHAKVTSLVSELSRTDTHRLCAEEADPVKKKLQQRPVV